MPQNIIRDGYTRRGYISPDDGIHSGISFTFRPMLAEHVEASDHQIEQANPSKRAGMIANLICHQLESWDEEDGEGKPVPITPDNVRRLPYVMLRRMHLILAGMSATDPLPEPNEDEEAAEMKRLLEGTTAQAELEADRGN